MVTDSLFNCHFFAAHYTYQGTVDKKGFKCDNNNIIEVVALVLQERHPKVSLKDVMQEFQNYFKCISQTSQRQMLKPSGNKITGHIVDH